MTLAEPRDSVAEDEVSRCVVAMLFREPFYAHLLGGVPRRIGDAVPTAAVALTPRGPELLVNPRFFLTELNADERTAVIKHEALHLVFRHLYRPRLDGANSRLFNVAADLVVNQYVEPWPLPESAVTLALFPDLGLKAHESVDYYYRVLHDLWQETQQQPFESVSAPKSAEALERILSTPQHGDHRFWAAYGGAGFAGHEGSSGNANPPLSESLRRALETDLDRQMVQARGRCSARYWDSLPAGVRELVSAAEDRRTPAIDWKRSLRLFASSGYRTRVVPTGRRMSKRFGTYPGVRIKREQHIAVVLDTSGSIDSTVLQTFFAEIHALWRSGASVTVIECDASVHRTYSYDGRVPDGIGGGGGTDFDPPFILLRENRRNRVDACVYLTDGLGPEPSVRPPCPVLWALTGPEGSGPHLKWGRRLILR